MSYRAEIAAMLRDMPSGWRRQYRVGRETLARNGGPVLPETPSPEQAMRILGNTAGGKADADTAAGDQPVPKAVRDAAMHGLRLSYTNNYGGWEFFGIARAIQLALMPSVPLRTRERMVRYLSDHAKDKAGRSFGDERHPSNGYMAWLNWGGDPAVAWNERDGIGRATYGAAARRTNGVKTAAVEAAAKLGAKVGIKAGGKFVPLVGEALMAIDVAREGRSLYKRRKAGEQIGWKEGTASLASSAIIGPEGVAWAKKKIEARKAKKNPRYTSAVRTHPKLWESVKVEVTRGSRGGLPGQWSARKAQIAVALYQQRGGGYVGPKSPYNALDKWTREDWRTRSGRPSLETGERYLPAAAIAALSPEEYAITSRAKRAGMRHGEQFVPQPKRIAEKVRKYRRNPLSDAELLRFACVGMCGEFAVALHREFGYPLGAFYEIGPDGWDEGDYTLIHAFAFHPSGKLVDSRGVRSRASMKRELLTTGGKIKEARTTETGLDSLSMEGLDPEVLHASQEYIRRNRSAFT